MTQHIGAATGISRVIPVTLSLDTNAYASGDLLADAQEIKNVFRDQKTTAVLVSVCVCDKDDQKQAMELYFTTTSTSWGTENTALSSSGPSDATSGDIQARVDIAASDYADLGGNAVANPDFNPKILVGANDSTSLYVAAVSRGTGTYSASGVTLKLGFLLD